MKPDGYTTVSPYLIVDGASQVIKFLELAFDATELRRFNLEDGSILHAEVRIDDSVVMLGDAGGKWPSIKAHLHIYVTDADATYQRAVDAGGAPVEIPAQREGDSERRGGIMDPGGNTWWIAQQVV